MTNAIIRPAKAMEADLISTLCIQSKKSNGYDENFMNACIKELTVASAMLATDVHLVIQRTEIDGYAALCAAPDLQNQSEPELSRAIGEVTAFYIKAGCQRQGLGSLLWNAIVDKARACAYTELRLDADPYAVPFYRYQGCKQIGQSASGSIPGRVLPRLALDLTQE